MFSRPWAPRRVVKPFRSERNPTGRQFTSGAQQPRTVSVQLPYSNGRHGAHMVRHISIFLTILMLLPGCGVDHAAKVDVKVKKQWMRPGNYVDAIRYLESGGKYYTASMPGMPDLDREAIIPLLKRLKKEFDHEQYAILVEDEDYCWGIVVKLPQDESQREKVEAFVEREMESFPGMILTEWGHEWLSLDFLDEQAAAVVREAEAAAEAAS